MPSTLAECGFRLFGNRGFAAVTIDEIAAEAGVTKGSFYNHYRSKREIILAACQHYYRSYQQKVHARIASIVDPFTRLRAVVEMSVRTCVIDRSVRVFTTEIFALSLTDALVRAGWGQFYDSVREVYVGLLTAAKAAGQTSVDDPRRAVDMMLSAIEGIKLRAVYEPHIAAEEEQKALVEGLMAILAPSHPYAANVTAHHPMSPTERRCVR